MVQELKKLEFFSRMILAVKVIRCFLEIKDLEHEHATLHLQTPPVLAGSGLAEKI